jgi:hypothetical protein
VSLGLKKEQRKEIKNQWNKKLDQQTLSQHDKMQEGKEPN